MNNLFVGTKCEKWDVTWNASVFLHINSRMEEKNHCARPTVTTLWCGKLTAGFLEERLEPHVTIGCDPELVQQQTILSSSLPFFYPDLVTLIMSYVIICRKRLDLSHKSCTSLSWLFQSLMDGQALDLLFIIPHTMVIKLHLKRIRVVPVSYEVIAIESTILFTISGCEPSKQRGWTENRLNKLIFGSDPSDFTSDPALFTLFDGEQQTSMEAVTSFANCFKTWGDYGTFLNMEDEANRSLEQYRSLWSVSYRE